MLNDIADKENEDIKQLTQAFADAEKPEVWCETVNELHEIFEGTKH